MEVYACGLRGMLRVLIDDLADRCPAEHRNTTAPAVLEGLHMLRMPLGKGLQSAVDCTRNLAGMAITLAELHKRVISE